MIFKLFYRFIAIITICFCCISPLSAADEIDGEEKVFVVSAYYSPLPNQESYVRGSYAADMVLNGKGIAGADGTGVYPGMLAAPRTYSFGTKIHIPGLGIGTVHDRGGAILAYEDFDRIDVWMGYGDEGRKRALQWGMRKITGKIVDSSYKDTLDYSHILPVSKQEKFIFQNGRPTTPVNFDAHSLWKGTKGERVKEIQSFLKSEGVFTGRATGYFGDRTEKAVIEFQKKHQIIVSKNDKGAGVFGPQTKKKMEQILQYKKSLQKYAVDINVIPPENMGIGDKGEEVKKLQIILKDLGYFNVTPNGVFGPQTQKSVIAFQKSERIIESITDTGAGYFGSQTHKSLEIILLERRKNSQVKSSPQIVFLPSKKDQEKIAQIKAQYGQRNEDVKRLQKILIKYGYLKKDLDTGYFGKQTKKAYENYMSDIS